MLFTRRQNLSKRTFNPVRFVHTTPLWENSSFLALWKSLGQEGISDAILIHSLSAQIPSAQLQSILSFLQARGFIHALRTNLVEALYVPATFSKLQLEKQGFFYAQKFLEMEYIHQYQDFNPAFSFRRLSLKEILDELLFSRASRYQQSPEGLLTLASQSQIKVPDKYTLDDFKNFSSSVPHGSPNNRGFCNVIVTTEVSTYSQMLSAFRIYVENLRDKKKLSLDRAFLYQDFISKLEIDSLNPELQKEVWEFSEPGSFHPPFLRPFNQGLATKYFSASGMDQYTYALSSLSKFDFSQISGKKKDFFSCL